jgi:hypothetical protein
MQQDKAGGEAPLEILNGGTLRGKEMQEKSYLARMDASPGHTREHHAEWTERNFAYYPKW